MSNAEARSINTFDVASPDLPFGGGQTSGYCRVHGLESLKESVNLKSIKIG